MRSNCLVGALVIRARLPGSSLDWRPWWSKPGVPLWGAFANNPWGHWRVVTDRCAVLSWSPADKDLIWWRQLWFEGRLKVTRP